MGLRADLANFYKEFVDILLQGWWARKVEIWIKDPDLTSIDKMINGQTPRVFFLSYCRSPRKSLAHFEMINSSWSTKQIENNLIGRNQHHNHSDSCI